MKRVSQVLSVFVLMVVSAMALAAEEGAAGTVRPCVVITGADSKVAEHSYHRITSQKEWINAWQRHKGEKESDDYNDHYNPLGVPEVDFEKFMVIAIFQGSSFNSAGLTAVSITEAADRILFRFDDKSFQTLGGDGGAQKVSVFGFFVIPRSMVSVVVEENVQNLKNSPPDWKEQISFPKLNKI
jgi:hypothetical protein